MSVLSPIVVVELGLAFWRHTDMDWFAKSGYITELIFLWLVAMWQVQKWLKS